VRKGLKSVQFGFKTTEEIAKKMEEERAVDGTTIAGFINDAIKHYIDYRENKRIALWEMRKEDAERLISNSQTEKCSENPSPPPPLTDNKDSGASVTGKHSEKPSPPPPPFA